MNPPADGRPSPSLLNPRVRQVLNRDSARVLIVDDDDGVRSLLYDVLSQEYECHCAPGGREAIELSRHTDFDVVLTDVMMPEVSGLDVLAHFSSHAPTTVVVLVTGRQGTQHAIEAFRLGAFDYLTKPFDIEQVTLSIGRAMKHRVLAEENRFYRIRLESLVVDRTSELQNANEHLEESVLELSLAQRAALSALAAVMESRNVDEHDHTERVASYALRLGRELGLDETGLHALEQGALLHDVGTIDVPETILRKPGPLDEAEWDAIRRHPERGARLVRRIGFLASAVPVVEQHHERWDGSGYPKGLSGEQIDLGARILAVADCIEAMTTRRPFRAAVSMREAAEELRRAAGSQFDPAVVAAFLRIPVDEWTRIRESSDAYGVPVARMTGPLTLPKGATI